jgi:hypothetical protein
MVLLCVLIQETVNGLTLCELSFKTAFFTTIQTHGYSVILTKKSKQEV